jgi:hypothetical protein
MSYDLELKRKMKEIEDRILSKSKIKRINLDDIGNPPKRGRIKDLKAEKLCDTFGMSRECLRKWRSGSSGAKKQRLWTLLYYMSDETLDYLNEVIR